MLDLLWEGLLAITLPGCEAVNVPFVKARRAIGFACCNTEAPLRRAERAASWAIEFMMISDGIDDGEWSFRCGFDDEEWVLGVEVVVER